PEKTSLEKIGLYRFYFDVDLEKEVEEQTTETINTFSKYFFGEVEINKEYRERGIGSVLVDEGIKYVSKNNMDLTVIIRNNCKPGHLDQGHKVKHKFEKAGFKPLKRNSDIPEQEIIDAVYLHK
ncbi:hypothetical protein ACFLTH_17475, partial [Bacteroidota bacterium]